MKTMTRQDIAKHLNIGDSTLRRYIAEMKKQGHLFSKMGKMEIYTDYDYLLIEQIKELTYEQGLALEVSVEIVLGAVNEVAVTDTVVTEPLPQDLVDFTHGSYDTYEVVELLKEEVNEFKYTQSQIARGLENLEQLIKKKENSRDEHLMMTFRLLQDEKKEREELKQDIKEIKKALVKAKLNPFAWFGKKSKSVDGSEPHRKARSKGVAHDDTRNKS